MTAADHTRRPHPRIQPASMLDLGLVDILGLFSPSMSSSPRICRESLLFGKNLCFLLSEKWPHEYLLTE